MPYDTDLDVTVLHVEAPSNVIFLCGGQLSDLDPRSPPLSLRDAFRKIASFPILSDKDVILAERITEESLFFSLYADVLEFETDLAQITELVLLFCEGVGSLAELGAFAVTDEIAKRMLVIVRDRHWANDSFIKLGPLRWLSKRYGSASIFVLDDKDTGMSDGDASHVNIDNLKMLLNPPLTKWFSAAREPTTFDASRPGHLIKLIVGLIQDYGALNIKEIQYALRLFAIDLTDLKISAYLLCAKSVDWIVEVRKGSDDFFVARDLKDSARFRLKTDAYIKNKGRRRISINSYWEKNEPLRYAGIIDVRMGATK